MVNNNQLANSDFLTAAFPGEYGNALSGIFDLKYKNGNTDNYEFLGQIGFNGFEFGPEGPISRKTGSSFTASYRYSTMGIFKLLGVTFGTGTAVPEYQDISFKVNLPSKKAGTFSVYGMGGLSRIEFLDSERDTNEVDFYGGEGYDLRSGSKLAIVGLTHLIPVGRHAFIKSGISYTYNDYYANQDSISPIDKEIVPIYRSNFVENRINLTSFIKKRVNLKNNFQTGILAIYYMSDLHDSILRTDFKIYYRMNMKKLDMEVAIDIQNIFNVQNIYSQNFNASTGEIYNTYQLGMLIIPQFVINF